MAAQHDDVDVLGVCGLEDRFGRIPFPDEEGDPQIAAAAAADQVLDGRLAAFADLVDPRSEPAAWQLECRGSMTLTISSSACDRAARSNASSVAATDAADSSVARSTLRRGDTVAPFGPIAR